MSPLRLTGSTSGYSEIDAPAVAGDQTFTLPGTGGTLDRLNRQWNLLQVVTGSTATYASTAGSTFIDTNLTATITPTSASSKILILVNQAGLVKFSSNTGVSLRLLRGSTTLLQFEEAAGFTNSTAFNGISGSSACYLDSPATTSATIYKTQFASQNNTNGVGVQNFNSAAAANSTITLMELAA